MNKKLFSGDMKPACEYCVHGSSCAVEGEVLCELRGIMLSGSSCRKYEYDPLSRKPKRPERIDKGFTAEDFML